MNRSSHNLPIYILFHDTLLLDAVLIQFNRSNEDVKFLTETITEKLMFVSQTDTNHIECLVFPLLCFTKFMPLLWLGYSALSLPLLPCEETMSSELFGSTYIPFLSLETKGKS